MRSRPSSGRTWPIITSKWPSSACTIRTAPGTLARLLYAANAFCLTCSSCSRPFLPYVTDAIYRRCSPHRRHPLRSTGPAWPQALDLFSDPAAEEIRRDPGQVATAVRRYKSEQNISLGLRVNSVTIKCRISGLADRLAAANSDLMSITRANTVEIVETLNSETTPLALDRADIQLESKSC